MSSDSAPPSPYPSIVQSIGIVGIIIALTMIAYPIQLLLEPFDVEAATFVYYVLSVGISSTLVYYIRKKKTGAFSFVFSIRPWTRAVPLIVGSIVLLWGIAGPISGVIPVPDSFQKIFRDLVGQTGVWTLLYFVIAAPIMEELIFRGIMLDGLLRRYSPGAAIFVSSLLFGVVHLNPWQFVTAMLMGLFSGWVYFRTASLGACILIHMAANGSGYVYRMVLKLRGTSMDFSEPLVSAYGGAVWMVGLIGGSVIVFLLCVLWLRRSFGRIGKPIDWRPICMARPLNAEYLSAPQSLGLSEE